MDAATHIALAQFGVLDFEQRARQGGPEELFGQYRELTEVVDAQCAGRVIVSPIPTGAPGGGLALAGCHRDLQSALFGDTVLLWIPYELPVVESFLESVCRFVCEGLLRGIPLSGLVTFGDAVMDQEKQVFSGTPISDCNAVEESERRMGVSVAASVEGHWVGALRLLRPLPAENGDESVRFVLDWPRVWREKYSEQHGPAAEVLARWAGPKWSQEVAASVKDSELQPAWWEDADWERIGIAGHVVPLPYGGEPTDP